jgi:tetratricopeptide (TPR) repeat protein
MRLVPGVWGQASFFFAVSFFAAGLFPMNGGRRVLTLPIVAASIVCLSAAPQAQQPQQLGKIVGLVRVLKADFTPVQVLVTLEARGAPIDSVYTDDQGRYGFSNLVANEYEITVNDDAYKPVAIRVNVNPAFSPTNFVQLTLEPRETQKKEEPANRVPGSNPYLIDPAEYYRHFPKKTLKEFGKGVDADRQGKTEEAVEHYQKAISYSPDFYPAHNNLGTAYLSGGNFEHAQREFEAAVKINQNDAQAYFNLGNVLLLTQRYDQAEHEIELGLQRRPDSAFGNFLQGSLCSHTGRPEQAEKSLLDALKLDPTMSQAHLQLVNLYLQQKRNADAIKELEVYLKSFPDTPFSPKARELLKRLRQEALSSHQ